MLRSKLRTSYEVRSFQNQAIKVSNCEEDDADTDAAAAGAREEWGFEGKVLVSSDGGLLICFGAAAPVR